MSTPIQARQYVLPKRDGIHNLTLTEAPVPKPRANEVLVKIHAVSLNNRDLAIADNIYPLPVKANIVPLSDAAGEVVAVGEDVHKWHAGDRVCANFILGHLHGEHTPEMFGTWLGGAADGVLAEYKVFPAESLVRIPDYLTWEEASTLPCAAVTAYNALHGPTAIKGGDWVLVLGTGGVSMFALQIAVASGANVIATSSSDAKLEFAKNLGAKYTINYKTHPDWEKEVQRLIGGRGVDHVVEVGGTGTFGKSLESIRLGGSVYVIGYVGGLAGETSTIPIKILTKAANVRGILIGSVQQFEAMNRLFEAREIRPVVDKVFDFEHALDAYKHLQSQKHIGNVVIKVQ